MNKYDIEAQREWLDPETWEDRRAREVPNAGNVFCTVALVVFGSVLVNSIADWVVGL